VIDFLIDAASALACVVLVLLAIRRGR